MSPDLHKELFMNKFLSIVIVLSVFVLLTAVTVSAQTAGRVVTADSALATSPILFPFQAAPAAVPPRTATPNCTNPAMLVGANRSVSKNTSGSTEFRLTAATSGHSTDTTVVVSRGQTFRP
jgi:hypothetical protein